MRLGPEGSITQIVPVYKGSYRKLMSWTTDDAPQLLGKQVSVGETGLQYYRIAEVATDSIVVVRGNTRLNLTPDRNIRLLTNIASSYRLISSSMEHETRLASRYFQGGVAFPSEDLIANSRLCPQEPPSSRGPADLHPQVAEYFRARGFRTISPAEIAALKDVGFKVCPDCGAFHLEADDTCKGCKELLATLPICSVCGKVPSKPYYVHLDDGTRAVVCGDHAVGCIECPLCGRLYDRATHGPLVCPTCEASQKTCAQCGVVEVPTSRERHGVYLCAACRSRLELPGYHSNISHNQPKFLSTYQTEFPEFFMGVELETAPARSNEIGFALPITKKLLSHLTIEATKDGSLPTGGIEFISQAMTIERWRKELPAIAQWFNALKSIGYRGHDASGCGLHVHVSRKAFDPDESSIRRILGRLTLLFARFESELLYLTRRNPNQKDSYARTHLRNSEIRSRINESDFDRWFFEKRSNLGYNDHYKELNLTSQTIEFRGFRSTLNSESFMAALEFIYGVCRYVRDHSFETCRTVAFADLIAWIDKPVLTAYVQRILPLQSLAEREGVEGEALEAQQEA